MACLSIRLFGSFEVTLEGEPVTGFASDKVRALLAYLVTESDRPHRREALAGLLWPDYPDRSARTNLRRALANLRTVIGDRQVASPFLSISRQTVQFNCVDDAWCDVTAFAQALEAEGPSPQAIDRLAEAVEWYRGSFLEGFSLGDSVAYGEWMLLKREQLRRQALVALHRLAVHYEEQGEYESALPYAWRQVELEPWQEEAQRQLMRLLALGGQPGLAVAQYEVCRRALAEQLGVEPAAETTRLYEQIRDGEMDAEDRPPAHEAGGAVGVTSYQPAETIPDVRDTATSAPLARDRPLRWPISVRKLALVGGNLLLLVLVSAVTFFALRGWLLEPGQPEPFEFPDPAAKILKDSKVVYLCNNETSPQICVYSAHTGELLWMTHDLEFARVDRPNWSPDGQHLVFSASNPESPSHLHHDLYTIDADGSNLKQLTTGPANDMVPAWSPDGEWIAFHRTGGLWLIRPDGSEAHVLWKRGTNNIGMPAWSPDSQQIAFPVNVDLELSADEIWIVDRQGTTPRSMYAIEQNPHDVELAWDPAGRDVVCLLTFKDSEKRILFNANGTDEPLTIDVMPPSWFPNFWPQWGKKPNTHQE